ncbi:MAG: Uma2 family endonuclease [Longimonas sp.]|uniref:Uma2 family endonuclease n=1 Tax=Longimonas sp. TaxID=2039626 RepID=UPI0039765D44
MDSTASAWHRALHDPQLRQLPYKIETNAHDQLLLSPHTPAHSLAQSRILRLLDEHVTEPGEATIEFAVSTAQGIKVPGVVWMSEEQLAALPGDAEASPVMPALVVEVQSPTNTDAEMEAKRALYLNEGAAEVWIRPPDGAITIFDASGARDQSALAPTFPGTVT